MLGRSANEYAVHVQVAKGIDRHAAEALIGAGMMAAMTRTPVRPHVVIVGGVKPDGALAPVRSLRRHARVVSAGIVGSFGYPEGQRVYADAKTGKAHDLDSITVKKTLSVEALSSLYDAYHLLTGTTIHVSDPLPAEQMSFAAEERQAYQDRIRRLLRWSRTALKRTRLPRRNLATAALKENVGRLHEDVAAARKLLVQGQLASAAQVAANVFGQSMAVADIGDWLADHEGDPVEQLRALSDWLYYPGHYGRILGSVVFSDRGIAKGNLAVCHLLDALRAQSLVRRALTRVAAGAPRQGASGAPIGSSEQLYVSDPLPLVSTVLSQLVRGYGKIRSARALDPLLSLDRVDDLVSATTVKRTAEALVIDAAARYRSAKLAARKLSSAQRQRLFELVGPQDIQVLAERLVNVRNLGVRHTLALSSAWVSMSRTSHILYQVHATTARATARVGAEHGAYLARVWASNAKDKLGYIPPEARFHYALAEERRARQAFAKAEALFDLSALDSRLAVMLATTQRRGARSVPAEDGIARSNDIPPADLTYDPELGAACESSGG
jgi:hypothetical protein